ncbi:glycoside hydrolase family 3 N-terminal domain-containing protein [Vibrio sp. SCSIO 43136]|uniref:glycoside hydrolase family 3 protein n=1 Tax=Vibrio sp. SCSIO 43136 TaxID=2819101 RepID=UPI00207624F1|nr:glycoside hydrolase family 3 N-terminal domain-containing protein [Vibrio sp. SCSIO 43136]USD67055.1 glycoside hydrolase family 3 C-terminal domain-containing protein [Vibrio sp. SCSIO 43136]
MKTPPYFSDWPKIKTHTDHEMESQIAAIVDQMTLEEKVGQMIQPNLRDVTAEEIKQYKLGSILNGGGAWPNEDKHASAKEWALTADAFWNATEEAFADRPFRIPFMWATDAVHGHNNVFGSTVFPHNIGLGAAQDPALIRQIGEITAREIVATGLDWTFAPTVAVPRNLRWGRVYEGYSEDPVITWNYAEQMVLGLQGDAEELKGDLKVVSNVKHWLGDGGTMQGIDRGVNSYSEQELINIHGLGYFSGLDAGAQVVMSSFNSWQNPANYDHQPAEDAYNQKIHGSKYLLTDVLKDKMGFDGLVVTDWHGHAEVNRCTNDDATYAINAGNDVLMIPVREHWQAVYQKTLEDIQSGAIEMHRIDDAVSRILRVKMRAGMWSKPKPSERALAGQQSILGAPEHRAVAREAVRKSLVLLKNDNQLLPINPSNKLWLTGSAANDLQKQSGGWNLTWQGDENTLADFPGATTLKMALEQEVEDLHFDPDLAGDYQAGDIAIVAFGEDPYAEMMGDIKSWQSLEFSQLKRSYGKDCSAIKALKDKGVKVIGLFFSGRPLYLNQEIMLCDAFVAAWLPGSEGLGLSDVLVADDKGQPRFDFVGQLPFSWPNRKRSDSVSSPSMHIKNYQVPAMEQDPNGHHKPLFERGYGLSYGDLMTIEVTLDDDAPSEQEMAAHALDMFGIRANIGDYQLKAVDPAHIMGREVSRNNPMALKNIQTKPYNYQQQQDAVEVVFSGGPASLYLTTTDGGVEDVSAYAKGLAFDIKLLDDKVQNPVWVSLQQENPQSVDIHQQLVSNEFVSIEIEPKQLGEIDLRFIETPFVLSSEFELNCVIANIRWQ